MPSKSKKHSQEARKGDSPDRESEIDAARKGDSPDRENVRNDTQTREMIEAGKIIDRFIPISHVRAERSRKIWNTKNAV